MSKGIALALIVAGVLALVYRGFSYTKERHEAKLGPLSLRVDEKERVNFPIWAGALAIGGGVVLLPPPRRPQEEVAQPLT
jgi:hypothetical protein